MDVKFVDLPMQYRSIKDEIDDAIDVVISEAAFIKGRHVDEFEQAFAREYNVKHCIGVGNGTDALYLALRVLDVGAGDEVITVANSWVSSAEVICQTGAKPIFVDIEVDYYNIDIEQLESMITSKTKAIIPVHLYGQPANIEKIVLLARKYEVFVVEDCAQAHFAAYNNSLVGTFGDVSAFSFYPGKNLGAYGDAGAVLTNNEGIARNIRMLANHGAAAKHKHIFPGTNSRLDGLQASVLNVKLKYIHMWTEKRIRNAAIYSEELQGIPEIRIPEVREKSKHVFHIYCILARNRNKLQSYLSSCGIETAIHYPVALPNMVAFKDYYDEKTRFPIASDYQGKYLSLPMYPELDEGQIKYVAGHIRDYYQQRLDK